MPIKEPAIVNVPLAHTPRLGTQWVDGTTEAVELSTHLCLMQINYRPQKPDCIDNVIRLTTYSDTLCTMVPHETLSERHGAPMLSMSSNDDYASIDVGGSVWC
jgi:hypothetical protein